MILPSKTLSRKKIGKKNFPWNNYCDEMIETPSKFNMGYAQIESTMNALNGCPRARMSFNHSNNSFLLCQNLHCIFWNRLRNELASFWHASRRMNWWCPAHFITPDQLIVQCCNILFFPLNDNTFMLTSSWNLFISPNNPNQTANPMQTKTNVSIGQTRSKLNCVCAYSFFFWFKIFIHRWSIRALMCKSRNIAFGLMIFFSLFSWVNLSLMFDQF